MMKPGRRPGPCRSVSSSVSWPLLLEPGVSSMFEAKEMKRRGHRDFIVNNGLKTCVLKHQDLGFNAKNGAVTEACDDLSIRHWDLNMS